MTKNVDVRYLGECCRGSPSAVSVIYREEGGGKKQKTNEKRNWKKLTPAYYGLTPSLPNT